MIDTDEVIRIVKSFVWKNKNFVDFYGDMNDFEQEMLLQVFSNIHKYDENKGKLASWIYAVCSNKAKCVYKTVKNKLRLNKCRSLSECVDDLNLISLEEIISDYVDFEETIVDKITVDKLKPLMSDDFKSKYLNNATCKDIAERKNLTKQAISKKLKNELLLLKEIVEK